MIPYVTSYDLSLLAKKMGFNEPCAYYYSNDYKDKTRLFGPFAPANFAENLVSATSHSHLRHWIREYHGIDCAVKFEDGLPRCAIAFNSKTGYCEKRYFSGLATYEELMDTALIMALEKVNE